MMPGPQRPGIGPLEEMVAGWPAGREHRESRATPPGRCEWLPYHAIGDAACADSGRRPDRTSHQPMAAKATPLAR